jgi:hypothetical protein
MGNMMMMMMMMMMTRYGSLWQQPQAGGLKTHTALSARHCHRVTQCSLWQAVLECCYFLTVTHRDSVGSSAGRSRTADRIWQRSA